MEEQKHSRNYHRYFEDYAETEVLDDSGRAAIQRVYVGSYYRVRLSDRDLRRQRFFFALLYLLAAALYLWAGLTAAISGVPVVALFTAAALIVLLLLALPVFRRITAPREMEVRTWRESSEQLRFWSLCAVAALVLCAAVTGAALFLLGCTAADLIGIVRYLSSAAAAAVIYWMERHTAYDILPPKHQRPEGSSPIRYYAPD